MLKITNNASNFTTRTNFVRVVVLYGCRGGQREPRKIIIKRERGRKSWPQSSSLPSWHPPQWSSPWSPPADRKTERRKNHGIHRYRHHHRRRIRRGHFDRHPLSTAQILRKEKLLCGFWLGPFAIPPSPLRRLTPSAKWHADAAPAEAPLSEMRRAAFFIPKA